MPKRISRTNFANPRSSWKSPSASWCEFAQKESLVNTGENRTSLATQNLTDLNGQLAAAQNQRIRAESRWRQASSGGAMPSDMLSSSGIGALQMQRGKLQAEYQQKLQTFKPDYPEMLQLKGQIDEVNRQMATEIGPAFALQ